MAPKKRLPHNQGLSKRWECHHGAYYYRVPPGQEHLWDNKRVRFRLGKTLSEAHAAYAARIALDGDISRMDALIDRYLVEVTPTKAPRTQRDEVEILARLKVILGKSLVRTIEPRHCRQLRDELVRKRGATTAKRHLEKLSHLFTMAIEWGAINDHPMKGKVGKPKADTQRRVPEDWEIDAALETASDLLKLYVRLKLLTGLRMSDMLSIKLQQIKGDGLHVRPRKTLRSSGKYLIFEWDEDGVLRGIIDDILALPRPVGSIWLFCTRRGQPYIKEDGSMRAFQSMWQRWMRKFERPFTERSLRTKVGSESRTVQEAADRLGHTTTTMTQRAYRERPTRVTPLVKK